MRRRPPNLGLIVLAVAVLPAACSEANADNPGCAALEAAQARYRQLDSLHQQCEWTHVSPSGAVSTSSELFFKRPNTLRLVDGPIELLSNGERLWIVDHRRREYFTGPAPVDLADPAQLTSAMAFPALATQHQMALEMMFSELPPPGCRNGSGRTQVMSSTNDADNPAVIHQRSEDGTRSWEYRIDPATGLFRGMTRSDVAKATERVAGSEATETIEVRVVVECRLIEPNAEIADDSFEYAPPAGYRAVEALSIFPHLAADTRMTFQERIEPTVRKADGSTSPVHDERLHLGSPPPGRFAPPFRDGDRADVDGDGIADLLLPVSQGQVLLVDGATGRSDLLTAGGRAADGNISRVRRVTVDGGVAWALVSHHHDRHAGYGRAVVSLHGPDGDELWVFSPEIEGSVDTKAWLAVSDLDRDGHQEIVTGIRMASRVPVNETASRFEEHGSLLTVLDTEGNRLGQTRLDGRLVDLAVGGTPDDPMILAVLSDRIVTVRFDPR